MKHIYKIYKIETMQEVAEVTKKIQAAQFIGVTPPVFTKNQPFPYISFYFSKGYYVVDILQPAAVAVFKLEKIKSMFGNPDKWFIAQQAVNAAWKSIEEI